MGGSQLVATELAVASFLRHCINPVARHYTKNVGRVTVRRVDKVEMLLIPMLPIGSRFHDRLVQQERYHPYVKDTTFIGPRPLVAAGNDYLSEKIACHLQ